METYNRDRHLHGVEEYEEQVNQTTGRDFSIGLAIGLLVGTVAGLLLAPKSGDALRDDITEQTRKLSKNKDGGSGEGGNFKEKVQEKTDQLRDKMEDKKGDISAKKGEMDEKKRVKSLDESAVKAQKDAIQEEVKEPQTDDPRTVDMSKYAEKLDDDKK
ncbi:YtxH domain-containing protein [Salinicoccus roseus]|uniref:YtxH domain-containing protein n=1 Tax=Salinicoccus roseus TaxID=45670 RepID=UPI003DA0FE66